jgi:hypothetical protein
MSNGKFTASAHMFANHVFQHYDANLGRQVNAPAEANHSSIRQRLGESY